MPYVKNALDKFCSHVKQGYVSIGGEYLLGPTQALCLLLLPLDMRGQANKSLRQGCGALRGQRGLPTDLGPRPRGQS